MNTIIILQISTNEIKLHNKIDITKGQKKILNYIFDPYLHLHYLPKKQQRQKKIVG